MKNQLSTSSTNDVIATRAETKNKTETDYLEIESNRCVVNLSVLISDFTDISLSPQ